MGTQPGNRLLREVGSALRQRSGAAVLGAAVVVVFVAVLAGSYFGAVRAYHRAERETQTAQLKTLGSLLAQSCEVMLADNELSAVRRVAGEAVRMHGLTDFRVVLPGGQVVADAEAGRITLLELPAQWSGSSDPEALLVDSDGAVMCSMPMSVPGRGQATLQISALPRAGQSFALSTQAAMGIAAGLGLAVLGGLYHLGRARARGLMAVREALLDYADGEVSLATLQVNGQWGPEAEAWNVLVSGKADEARASLQENARQALAERRGQHGPLNAACDALSQGLILVGEDLRAQYVNGAAAVLLQASKEDLQTQDVTDFLPDEQIVQAVHAAANKSSQKRTVVEIQRDESAGAAVLRFVVRPIRRGDDGVAMIVVEDITQQRMAEKARHAFVAQATHELRTPLTNICLYAETGLDEGEQDPGIRLNSLNVINQEARRLERMVGDMLSVAEIEAGALRLRRDDVRLGELIAQLQADYEASAKEKDIELTFNLPPKLPVLHGDRDKISLGLHNLVGNAMKYTPAGGKVAVDVRIDVGRVFVEVTDTGIGIDQEECERIFDKFYRSQDKRVGQITGTGLGLAIAREVIRLHGGDITLQSELNKGSTFTLMLPVTGEAA